MNKIIKSKNLDTYKYPNKMEWIGAEDFPQEMASNVQNLDAALSEIEAVVNELTSLPLTEAHSTVSFCVSIKVYCS